MDFLSRPNYTTSNIWYTSNVSMSKTLKDGDRCVVISGTHKGKSGMVRDLNVSKTGAVTITVVQENGERFKTLEKNVEVI